MPGRHHREHLPDALHWLPELAPEGVEGHDIAFGLRFFDAVLVYAQAAYPRVLSLGIQGLPDAKAVHAVCDIANRVAPSVAQHDLCNAGIVLAVDAVHVGRPQPAVPRANHVLPLWADDRRFDVVDLGVPGQTNRLHLRQQLPREVVGAHASKPMASAPVDIRSHRGTSRRARRRLRPGGGGGGGPSRGPGKGGGGDGRPPGKDGGGKGGGGGGKSWKKGRSDDDDRGGKGSRPSSGRR
mmetsp:Transcript_96227/g.258746  ORF Transcript_96227/g.258746 Transcript_96227/m.258746 type:complete len:239 (-) Transcript_96227:81-797(-)